MMCRNCIVDVVATWSSTPGINAAPDAVTVVVVDAAADAVVTVVDAVGDVATTLGVNAINDVNVVVVDHPGRSCRCRRR